jgi:dienelactone hydrolase
MRLSVVLLVSLPLLLGASHGVGFSQPEAYKIVFYPSGSLRIQAYLYLPQGQGSFPVVIYNHGSRTGQERTPIAWRYVGDLLTKNGYAALVPERRGYGKSEGLTYIEEVGKDVGPRFVARMQAETDDVLAAVSFIGTVPGIDPKRMGIMGWSLGGIVTMFAVSRTDVFRAAVDQAGGSLTWDRSPALRAALERAAHQVKVPVLFMDAQNDRTTESITTLAKILQLSSRPQQVRIYPSFTPSPAQVAVAQRQGIALGHLIFDAEGMPWWQNDVVGFLDQYVK